MRDETEITQSFDPVQPPPPAEPPPGPPPAGPPPPGPPGPPRALIDDVWPWLALLLLIVVGGLLVWLFVLRDSNTKSNTVPAVVGMPQQQAFDLLQKKGCSVRAIIEPANKPRGIVVSQAPSPGTRIDKGCTVTLHISNGRPLTVTTAPTTTARATTTATTTTSTTPAAQVTVPDVTGQDMVTASGQIEAAGFVPETQPVESANQQSGQVVAQDPPAGTQAPAGSTVVLQVAVSGQQPVKQVPDVLGQKAAAARQALLQAGFTVKTELQKSPANRLGVVVAQRPAGGTTQPQYTQVTITVGS
jgi:serine/threonine-protein kinase